MRHHGSAIRAALVCSVLAVCSLSGAEGQWARQAGERVRDSFGPTGGVCRGACGMGCPAASCAPTVSYECAAADALQRVTTYACGTHQGCRVHDDCLDRCRLARQAGIDCDATCHTEAVTTYGIDTAAAWGVGRGPHDPQPIVFEYTRSGPDEPQPLFRCPTGASRSCGAARAGQCLTPGGQVVAPVFDRYPDSAGTMRLTRFRSGRVCVNGGTPSGVCEETSDITVAGDRGWYGFEFDYTGANPSEPMRCLATGAEDDFMGSVMKGVLSSLPADESTEAGRVLGRMQSALDRGASLTDILSGIRIGSAGNPAPAAPAVGTAPGVPTVVPVPSASGHLLVPMFETASGHAPGSTLTRHVRCSQAGRPVLETTFRLHFGR